MKTDMKLKMKEHRSSGKLITFCGLDGCGKTTLISMLRQYFIEMDQTVFLTKQPTGFVRQSDIFRNFMDEPKHDNYEYRALSLLAASDRVQHSNQVILPALSENDVVISDRYFYSCLANLRARGYENDKWIYEIAQLIPKPDISFFLDIDVDTAVKRVKSREEEKDRYIDFELQYELREQYLKIAGENEGIVIPTNGSAEQSFEAVKAVVNKISLTV